VSQDCWKQDLGRQLPVSQRRRRWVVSVRFHAIMQWEVLGIRLTKFRLWGPGAPSPPCSPRVRSPEQDLSPHFIAARASAFTSSSSIVSIACKGGAGEAA